MIKIEISTHSGDVDVVDVEDYDPQELEEKRNNNEIQAIAIGGNVYSRIDLKNVKLIVDEASAD